MQSLGVNSCTNSRSHIKLRLERQLQVADVAPDFVVLGISGGLPKRNSDVVLICDEGGHAVSALSA